MLLPVSLQDRVPYFPPLYCIVLAENIQIYKLNN